MKLLIFPFIKGMLTMRLIIVGNGFDLHHGMKTRAKDYCEYLKSYNPRALESIINSPYFNGCCRDILDGDDVFWSDVESNLSFDYEKIIDDMLCFVDTSMMSNDEDYADDYSYDDGIALLKKLDEIYTSFTSSLLDDWIKHIELFDEKPLNKVLLESDDLFVSLNYTRTLEEVYHISNDRILHLHGCHGSNSEGLLQFGNTQQTAGKIREIYNEKLSKDVRFERISESEIEELEDFAESMSKNLERNIPNLMRFLEKKKITEVVIMGHSYLKSDWLYYEKVFLPKYSSAKWTIYCYAPNEYDDAKDFFSRNKLDGKIKRW